MALQTICYINQNLTNERGQSLQEYGLIAGLVVVVAIGSLSVLGQTNQNLMQQNQESLFGTNQNGPVQQLVSLLNAPQNTNNQNSFTSNIGTFQFQGRRENFQFSVDPATGYYQLNQTTNTTASEGLNNLFDFTNDAVGMLKQLAKTGKLPDGTPLSQEEKAALSQLSVAGFGLNGAQLWLGGSQSKLEEMGVAPKGKSFQDASVNNRSFTAWGFSHANPNEKVLNGNDYRIMDGLVNRYQNFQETFKQVAPLLSQNQKLSNIVNPLVGGIDQVSRKQFYEDPANYGDNMEAHSYVTSRISPPLNIRGPVSASAQTTHPSNNTTGNTVSSFSQTSLSKDQAINFTYQASAQIGKASGNTNGVPTLDDLIKLSKQG